MSGKDLGRHRVSGDLTGLARIKFDVPGRRPPRFRLVYRQVDDNTREPLAVGRRDEDAIYRTAVRRLARGEGCRGSRLSGRWRTSGARRELGGRSRAVECGRPLAAVAWSRDGRLAEYGCCAGERG